MMVIKCADLKFAEKNSPDCLEKIQLAGLACLIAQGIATDLADHREEAVESEGQKGV